MKYSELLQAIENNLDYLKHHNKNLTKRQEYAVYDLQDLVHELNRKIQESGVQL